MGSIPTARFMDHNTIMVSIAEAPIVPERPLAEQEAQLRLNKAMHAMNDKQMMEFAYRPRRVFSGSLGQVGYAPSCVGSHAIVGYGGSRFCHYCGSFIDSAGHCNPCRG